jgi:hypothetical protein
VSGRRWVGLTVVGRLNRKTWFLSIGAVVLIGGVVVARLIPEFGTARHLRELRAAGLPTSAAELDRYYKTVPAAENGALGLLDAAQWIVQASRDADPYSGKFKLPPPGEPLPEPLRNVIEKHLASNQTALEMFRELRPRMNARYPIDLSAGPNTLLPHLAQIKAAAQLLKLEAIHAALSGDTERAVRAILSGITAAETLRDEPLVISQIVRIAMLTMLLDALERTLSTAPLTDGQLARLEDALRNAEEESHGSMRKGFLGERAMGLGVFNMSLSEIDRVSAGDGNGLSGGLQAIMNILQPAGFRAWDKNRYLELMGMYDETTAASYPARIQKADATARALLDFLQTPVSNLAIFTRMLVPALEASIQKEGYVVAQMRCARAALAVERYRLANDGLRPADLRELVPKYFSAIPEDPFDGSALEIEATAAGGFIIHAAAAAQDRANSSLVAGIPATIAFSVAR